VESISLEKFENQIISSSGLVRMHIKENAGVYGKIENNKFDNKGICYIDEYLDGSQRLQNMDQQMCNRESEIFGQKLQSWSVSADMMLSAFTGLSTYFEKQVEVISNRHLNQQTSKIKSKIFGEQLQSWSVSADMLISALMGCFKSCKKCISKCFKRSDDKGRDMVKVKITDMNKMQSRSYNSIRRFYKWRVNS